MASVRMIKMGGGFYIKMFTKFAKIRTFNKNNRASFTVGRMLLLKPGKVYSFAEYAEIREEK